ncbi:MAG: hypothetical protein ACJ784_01055 [Myxococcales bacterium]
MALEMPEGWKPSLNPDVDLRELPLTPEEGFIISRLDGVTDLRGLCLVTGLPAERIEAVLERLVALGAVVGAEPVVEEEAEPSSDDSGGTHRKLYESAFHHLPPAERAARARTADEPDLSALCFDSLPQVVHALLENPRFALPQARLVATHHRTAAGLEALAAPAAFAADVGVRKALVRNPELPASLLRRLFGGRRLIEQFKLVVSHEVPEQTRRTARELLRTRFPNAEAEERVDFIFRTEGRCLRSLIGVPIDAKTAALLCGRTFTSPVLVQNMARWTVCPPSVIAHLLKQDIVRRSPALKTLVQRHPNAPR